MVDTLGSQRNLLYAGNVFYDLCKSFGATFQTSAMFAFVSGATFKNYLILIKNSVSP